MVARRDEGLNQGVPSRMDLLDKLRAVEQRAAAFADGSPMPGLTVIDRVLGPCEVVVRGRPPGGAGSAK